MIPAPIGPFLSRVALCAASVIGPSTVGLTAAGGATGSVARVASVRGEDWSCFRGPSGLGVSDAKGLPSSWGPDENLVWKTPLPGAGASSPIVFGDSLYLTSYTGYLVPGADEGNLEDLTRHLLCLDRKSGKVRWKKDVPAAQPEEERIRDHGYAASTPAADADHVYVFFGKSGVFAFDHHGEEKWRADVGTKTHGWGSAASLALYEDLVLVNASVESESLVALDRKTGEERWRVGGVTESWSTPVIVKNDRGEDELIMPKHGKVLGIDPKTGEELWSCDTDITWYMVPSAVADAGVVYVLGGRSGVASLAVRTGGRGDVTASHRLWTSRYGSNVSSPVIHDGHLYWMHDSKGTAYCADAKTGELVYEESMNRGGQVYASALLADGKIFHLDRGGRTFVLAAKPRFELLTTNDLRDGSVFDASPVVVGKRILVRSGKFLYCIGE